MRSAASTALCLVLALASVQGCGDPAAEGLSNGTLHGVVRDAQTRKRLKGVRVKFTSDTLDTLSASTDDDGSYDFAILSDTPHGRVEASKSGYETRVKSVFLDDGDIAVDIELAKQ